MCYTLEINVVYKKRNSSGRSKVWEFAFCCCLNSISSQSLTCSVIHIAHWQTLWHGSSVDGSCLMSYGARLRGDWAKWPHEAPI